MTAHHDNRATPARRRRGPVVAGAVGLLAVLGAGSYVIIDRLRGGDADSGATSTGQIDSIGTFTVAPAKTSSPSRPAAAPLTKTSPAAAGKGAALKAETRTEKTAQGSMRITTARGDLTGQQDQRLAGDNGEAVGAARCTSKLRFANAAQPQEMPAVLLCWRTSATKSVVTMAVANNGAKPSSATSAAVIAKEWTKLG